LSQIETLYLSNGTFSMGFLTCVTNVFIRHKAQVPLNHVLQFSSETELIIALLICVSCDYP